MARNIGFMLRHLIRQIMKVQHRSRQRQSLILTDLSGMWILIMVPIMVRGALMNPCVIFRMVLMRLMKGIQYLYCLAPIIAMEIRI